MILAPFGIVLGRFWCRLKNINLFQPYIFDYSAVDGPNEIVDRRSLDSPCPKKKYVSRLSITRCSKEKNQLRTTRSEKLSRLSITQCKPPSIWVGSNGLNAQPRVKTELKNLFTWQSWLHPVWEHCESATGRLVAFVPCGPISRFLDWPLWHSFDYDYCEHQFFGRLPISRQNSRLPISNLILVLFDHILGSFWCLSAHFWGRAFFFGGWFWGVLAATLQLFGGGLDVQCTSEQNYARVCKNMQYSVEFYKNHEKCTKDKASFPHTKHLFLNKNRSKPTFQPMKVCSKPGCLEVSRMGTECFHALLWRSTLLLSSFCFTFWHC